MTATYEDKICLDCDRTTTVHVYGSPKAAADVRYDLRVLGYPKIEHCTLDQLQDQKQILAESLANRKRVA